MYNAMVCVDVWHSIWPAAMFDVPEGVEYLGDLQYNTTTAHFMDSNAHYNPST